MSDRPVGVATSTAYLPELESLRGVAILLVLVFHVDSFMRDPMVPRSSDVAPWLAFVRAGHTGVSLFFVLSAFLLSLPFFAAAAHGRSINLRRYAARRALRILPLYYAAVVVSAVLSAREAVDVLRAVPYMLFLNMLVAPLVPYSSVWWSLATEVQFYVLLPLLGPCLRSRAARWCAVVALALYACAYLAMLGRWLRMPSITAGLWLHMSVFGRGPLFLAGIGAAGLYATYGGALRKRLAANPWAARGGADLLLGSVVATLGILLQWVVRVGPFVAESMPRMAWHVLEGILWSAVLLLVLLAPLRTRPVFCNRWLAALGVLSYSIYIVHVPLVLFALKALAAAGVPDLYSRTPRSAAIGVVLIGACVAISAVTYRLIERPFLVRKEALGAPASR
jgi:peptidoglycan/LPS O-acetylase OafA/YrhL